LCRSPLAYAVLLCKKANKTELPPLQDVSHHIPIIDPSKSYSYRPSKCPAAFLPLWAEKCDQYLNRGHWRFAMRTNASPLMLLKKSGKPGKPLQMRNTINLRKWNANTRKLASPLPDQRAILHRVVARKYVRAMKGKDTYEQIHIAPEDVKHTLIATPDGTIESLQQGDWNAVRGRDCYETAFQVSQVSHSYRRSLRSILSHD
jgi:hypothetical protein